MMKTDRSTWALRRLGEVAAGAAGAAGTAERLLCRHRTSLALVFVYYHFFWRLYQEPQPIEGKPAAVVAGDTGVELLDAQHVTLLTRASVLASAKGQRGTTGKPLVGLRREAAGQPLSQALLAPADAAEEDAVELLSRALQEAPLGHEGSEWAPEVYKALANLHSASGSYYKMLHAAHLAAQHTAPMPLALAQGHTDLGYLELKHHRYYAAGTRFADALREGLPLEGAEHFALAKWRAATSAGAGWAALLQPTAGFAAAREAFCAALGAASLPCGGVAPAPSACRARGDGLDGERVLALAGLVLVGVREDDRRAATARGPLQRCLGGLLRGSELQEPWLWNAVGLVELAQGRPQAARTFHLRALRRELQQPGTQAATVATCSTAADVTSCSHSALLLGAADYGAGRAAAGSRHVEELLARAAELEAVGESAQWLLRFARAHRWIPGGGDYVAFLFGRALPLLESQGEEVPAEHLEEYRALLSTLRAAHAEEALAQRPGAVAEKLEL